MGYLTAIAITPPNGRYVENGAASLKEHSQSGVVAEFKIDNRAYRYAVSGISLSDVPLIPMLYPCLRMIFSRDTHASIRTLDPNYASSRELTFSDGRSTTEKITLTSSFRALANLLDDVANKRVSGIQSLRIDDEARNYKATKGNWRKSGWELVQLAFPKIQPLHFRSLTALQVELADKSAVVINGMNDLFARGCFPNLKSLKLPINGIGACWHEDGWLSFDNHAELKALQNLLENGLIRAN